MLLLFRSIYAEGNTEPRKEIKEKRTLIRPLRESNSQCLAFKADTLSLSHYEIDKCISEKTEIYTYRKRDKGLTQIQS